jgi:flagellar basal-body rod protein FlgF
MNEVLAVGLQSMQSDMARLDQIAMNLANVLTPGYKRGVTAQGASGATFAAHLSGVAPAGSPTGEAPVRIEALVDPRVGSLRSTAQPLDVALTGKGYFEVMTADGPAYTRHGTFHIDARGRLVTPHGYPVMGVGGEIILNAANPTIDSKGAIFVGSNEVDPVAKLRVVEFEDESRPTRVGDGLLSARSGSRQAADQDIQVRQGFLENSNVSSTYEMTSMIHSMRHFESMQKVVQGYDDMLGTAIRKLGDNS